MELIKKTVDLMQGITCSGSARIKGVLTPPEGLPAIEEVLAVTADATAAARPAATGLNVEGTVRCHVLYRCAIGRLHGYEAAAPFAAVVSETLSEGAQCAVACRIGGVEYNLFGGDVQFTCTVELDCCCLQPDQAEAACGAPDELPKKTASLSIPHTEFLKERLELRDESDLSQLCDEIPFSSCFCRVKDCRIMGRKAVVSGVLHLCFLPAKADICTKHVEKQLPFEAEADLPEGADSCTAAFSVRSHAVELTGEDKICLRAEVDLCLFAVGQKEHRLLEDLYSTRHRLSLESRRLCPAKGVAQELSAALRLQAKAEDGFAVSSAALSPLWVEWKAEQGCLLAKGMVQCLLPGQDEQGKAAVIRREAPFGISFPCPNIKEETPFCAELRFADGAAMAGDDCINIQATAYASLLLLQKEELTVITDAKESGLRGGMYGPVVYFPTEEETRWDVCKRFGLAEGELELPETGLPPAILVNMRRG